MNLFKIGNDDFGVQDIDFEISNGEMYIRIYGDESNFNKLTEDEDGDWSWALDAPELYFNGIPFSNEFEMQLSDEIFDNDFGDDFGNDCEFALYMMEHNDIEGKLSVRNKVLKFSGTAYIMDEDYDLEVEVELP